MAKKIDSMKAWNRLGRRFREIETQMREEYAKNGRSDRYETLSLQWAQLKERLKVF